MTEIDDTKILPDDSLKSSPSRTKKHFSQEEDEKLKELVGIHGSNQWQVVASQFEGRTPRQLRDRWKNYLNPNVSNAEWSIEENKRLLQYVRSWGTKWAQLAHHFPGRTDVNLKNHWHKLERHAKKLDAPLLVNQVHNEHQLSSHGQVPVGGLSSNQISHHQLNTDHIIKDDMLTH